MKLDDNLSEHFTLKELINTSYAQFMKEQEKEIKMFIAPLTSLCKDILEPARLFYNKPMIISSGFRGKALNKAVGGSSTSQHCRGEAADFIINGIDNKQIMRDIYDGKIINSFGGRIAFGQCIHEIIKGKDWIHISLGYPYRVAEKSGEMLDTKDGKIYEVYNG
ncbi:MAG: peptidase M15 [Elusimicrobiota bacterium]|jgi:hypothetical protein|nr:peptidase M15 [Elusimicrobiota bacterium]